MVGLRIDLRLVAGQQQIQDGLIDDIYLMVCFWWSVANRMIRQPQRCQDGLKAERGIM